MFNQGRNDAAVKTFRKIQMEFIVTQTFTASEILFYIDCVNSVHTV